MKTEYDFIVVGSGSSGGVIASRLTESGKYSVLCLEAGTKGAHYIWSRPPLGNAFMIADPSVNWCYYSEPNESHGNRPIYVPRGKMLGGTSSINGTIYSRGQQRDYNTWAQMGCRGWSYEDVLPYFKKLESTELGLDAFRGREGPIKVTETKKLSPFYDLFIQSAQAVGIPFNADHNGASQEGVVMVQRTVHHGLRQSTATQYLEPARKRSNLTILRGAEVTSLVLNGKSCVGVRFKRRGSFQEVRAKREVVVSCGTANSPKLLELSGIGNPEILGKHGIQVVHELRGVGENLRDHFAANMKWRFSEPGISIAKQGRGWRLIREILRFAVFREGFITQPIASLRVFTRSRPGLEGPDIMMDAGPYIVDAEPGGRRKMSRVEGFFLFAQVQRNESTGNIHIRSSDPFAPPMINYRFLDTENDRQAAIMTVRRSRELVESPPLRQVVAEEIEPGNSVQSDNEIIQFIRDKGVITHHMIGTCKMGHDPAAVVDDRLKVHGIKGLRIADASIMPTLTSGNTSIPCVMIGEKCAELLLEEWGR